LLTGLTVIASLLPGASVPAQETAEVAAKLVVEEILVDPASPGADTLCKLSVKIRNDGTETASQFGFTVTINGEELTVYGNQLFMYPVQAGSSLEFPLYNFWTTETSRGMPPDGKLRLEITLKEAVWMKIELEDEVETWTPLGAVPGLPTSSEVVLEMSPGTAG